MAGADYRNPNQFYAMQKKGLATHAPLFPLPADYMPANLETEEEEEEEEVVEGEAVATPATSLQPPANWKIHEVQSMGFTGDVIQTSVRSDGRVIQNGSHTPKITHFMITNASDVYTWAIQQPTVPRPNGFDMPERSVVVWNADTNTIIVSKRIAVKPDMPLENIAGSETVESYPEGERDRSLDKLEAEVDKINKEKEEAVVEGKRSVFATSRLTTDVERKQTLSPQVWVIRQSEMRGKDRIITYVSSDGDVVENSNSVDYSLHFKISNPQEIYDWVKEQKDAPLENNVKRLVKVWSLNTRKIVIDKRISGSEKPLPFKKDPKVEEKKTDYDSEELNQFDRIVDEDVGIEIFALNPKSTEPTGGEAAVCETKRVFVKPTSGNVMPIQLCIWGEDDPTVDTASPELVNVFYEMWQAELELWNEIGESEEARAFIEPNVVRGKPTRTSASTSTFLVVFVPGKRAPRPNEIAGWEGYAVLSMKETIPVSIFEVLAFKPDLEVVVKRQRFLREHPEERKPPVSVLVHLSDALQSKDSQAFVEDTFWPALKRAAATQFAYKSYVVRFLTQVDLDVDYDMDLFVRSADKKDSSRVTAGDKTALLSYVDRTQPIKWQVDSIMKQLAREWRPIADRYEFHSQVEFLTDQKATSEEQLQKLQKRLDLESADELFTIRVTLAPGTHDQYISVQAQPTETSMYVGDDLEHSVRRVIVDERKEYKTHPAIVQARRLYAMGTFSSYELVVGVGIVDNSDLTYDASKITEESGNSSIIQLFAAKLIDKLQSLQPVVTEGLTNTVRTIHSEEMASSTPSSSSRYVDQNWEASATRESTWRKARTSTASKRPFFIVLSDALVPKYLEMEKAQAIKDSMEAKLDPQQSLRILLTQSAKVQREARATTEVNNAWPFVLSVPLDDSLRKNDVAEMQIILKAVRLRLDQLFLQERRFDARVASGVLSNTM